MCDFIPGQLVLCYPWGEPAGDLIVEQIQRDQIEHVRYVESIQSRIARSSGRNVNQLEYSLHLVAVPEGQEEWKVTYLQFYYKQALLSLVAGGGPTAQRILQLSSRSNYQFTAATNHVLSVAGIGAVIGRLFGRSSAATGVVDAAQFSFSADHARYKTLLGISGAMGGATVRVGVLDTGIGDNFGGTIGGETDFTGTVNSSNRAEDDNGHGTMVAVLIDDVAPGCEFEIMKVADSSGTAAEWDVLAALCSDHRCDVLNISLAFGLQDAVCATCGRQSHGSRSAVFENIIDSTSRNSDVIVVGAAGNQSLKELDYPARFGNVLAVGSVSASKSLSGFSNVGNTAHDGQAHTQHCVAPGGQTAGAEAVGSSPHDRYFGTSFAAAYATGIVAREMANGTSAGSVVSRLQGRADINLPGYSAAKHGFGLLQA